MRNSLRFIFLWWVWLYLTVALCQGIEWKKVYSLSHPVDLGDKDGFFLDHKEAENKNADNETADMFSILYQLEQYRTCSGEFHFKICYPELIGKFPFPCNEWTQLTNPVIDYKIKDFKPINITFQSETEDFKGLGLAAKGNKDTLIDDHPFLPTNRTFSIGTTKGIEGKIPGPGSHLVEKVELFVNTDKMIPKMITNENIEDSDIFEECSKEGWKAPEGATGDDAKIVIDMGCPLKLQDIQLINGAGDFSTEGFSVFASHNARGPWNELYSGILQNNLSELENCSLSIFQIPPMATLELQKMRFYKVQVDSFYGKGGGLKYLKLNGTRLGNLFVRKVDTMNANCTISQSYSWSCCKCEKTVDQDYTRNSFWYTTRWKGAIGTWIKIDLPRQAYVESVRLLQSYYTHRANKKVEISFSNGFKFTAFTPIKGSLDMNVIEVPNGIVLSAGSSVKITLLEAYALSYNGWSEIEFYGTEDPELLNLLVWKGVSMKKAIEEGKSPGIRISGRTWNDESSGTIIEMDSPAEKTFTGQTFCIRTMISGFMVDASNIMRFEGVGNLSSNMEYSMEFWIFKPTTLSQQFGLLVLNLGETVNQFSTTLGMDQIVLPFEWHSFCISINIGLKQAKLFHNGHIQLIQRLHELETETEDQFKFMTSGYIGGAKFQGTLVDFEAFGRPLPDQDLLKWTLCQNEERGDLFSLQLDYKQIVFVLDNSNIVISARAVSKNGLCLADKTDAVLEAFQDNVDKEAQHAGSIFCDTLNGKMVSFPETFGNLSKLIDYKTNVMDLSSLDDMAIAINAKSYSIPLPHPDMRFSDAPLDIYDMESETLLAPEERVLQSLSKGWNAYQTIEPLCYILTTTMQTENITEGLPAIKSAFTTELCNRVGNWWTVCKFEKKVTISLSGLCDTSSVDRLFYLIDPESKDRYGTFIGMTGWLIEFDNADDVWKIHHQGFPQNTIKLLDSSRRPFGKKTWDVSQYVCAQGKTVPLLLQLSNCEEDDFTCNDGTCVPFSDRCDKKPDCRDISDEKQCRIVALDEKSYIKDDPPPALIYGEKLNVTLSVNIMNILDIQEVSQIMILKFDLENAWLDKRLELYNLKKDAEMNTLSFTEKSTIWVPTIIFSNTNKDLTSLNDKKTFSKVIRNSKVNGTLISAAVNEDILTYQGSENEIRMNRVYEVTFICNYDMRYYPFDIQICTVDLVVDDNTAKFLELQPGTILYTGAENFGQYYIMSYDIYSDQIKGKAGVKVEIVLGRKLLGVVLTAYTPTVLLNIIGHSTNYFKSFFFEAVVTVNLTCMLVLATMFISIAENLPKTAYLKMMDLWLIFNLLLPFIEILLHTYMERATDEDDHIPNSDPVLNFLDDEHDGDLPKDVVMVRSKSAILKQKMAENLKIAQDQQKRQAEIELIMRKKAFCRRMSHVYNPIAALTFVAIYWAVGLRNAQFF